MGKAAWKGTGKVFRFSLQQYAKSKATYVLLLVMLVGTAGSVLIAGFSMEKGAAINRNARQVYVRNVGTYVPALDAMPDYVAYESVQGALEPLLDRLDEEPDAVLLDIDYDEALAAWRVRAYTGADSKVLSAEAESLAACCAGLVEQDRYLELGADPEQVSLALAPVRVEVLSQEELEQPEAEDDSTRYLVGLAYGVLVYMLVNISTSFIVRSVMEEKSNRLVEVLVLSVRPLALICGKILAAMILVVLGTLCAGLGMGLSRFVLGLLGRESSMLTGLGQLLAGLDLGSLCIVMLSVLLGYLSFAILAGIAGASCATGTQTDNAAGSVVMAATVCYAMGIGTAMVKGGAFVDTLCVLPFFSVFTAPARYLSGDIRFWVLALGWVLQGAVTVLLFRASAGIYGALLIHSGERVRLRQILRLMKEGMKA